LPVIMLGSFSISQSTDGVPTVQLYTTCSSHDRVSCAYTFEHALFEPFVRALKITRYNAC